MIESSNEAALLSAEIVRVAAGDKAALHRVYRRTFAKLIGVCRHVLFDPELVEDAVQETYLKVWLHADAFDPSRASPITWLCVLARNTAIDQRRAMMRREALSDQVAGRMLSPGSSDIESYELHGQLRVCLDGLDDPPRGAIRSAFFSGFSYAELAARERTALGTMKSWIRRGLLQLRRCLDDGGA